MKIILLTIVSFILGTQSYANIYLGRPVDTIQVKGESSAILENPLDSYLKYSCDISRLVEYDINYFSPHYSDAITRTWTIQGEKLHLLSIRTNETNEEYPLTKLFPNTQGAVFASWYSGLISYSYGDFIGHSGDNLIWEKQKIYQIYNGEVIKETDIDNKQRAFSYANIFLRKRFPFLDDAELTPDAYLDTTTFLEFTFFACNETYMYGTYRYPYSVKIESSANLDNFKFKKKYRDLSYLDLINLIVKETETTLEINFIDGDVIYKIKSEPVN